MNAAPVILITDYVHPNLLNGLHDQGYRFSYAPEITREQVLPMLDAYAGIVINTKIPADRELINSGPNLRFIARLGSGLDIIDLPYARQKGIEVIRAAEANANAVAEHVFAMLLSLFRRLDTAREALQEMRFEREENRGIEIEGKTIGIIGFGNTGRRVAEKFEGWNVRVLAYDKYLEDYTLDYPFIEETTLEKLLSRSDVVSLHVPLTDETQYMANRLFFEKMKEKAVVVNTSRGKVLNTQALMEALDSGKLYGACLDVFENEKPATYSSVERTMYSDLFSRDNVIISPHIAGWTYESKRKISDSLLEKISLL